MYRPSANIVRNGVSGGALISSHIPPGAIFRPADLFRDTGKRRKKNKCSGVVVWVIYTLPMIMMMTIPAIRPGDSPTNTQQNHINLEMTLCLRDVSVFRLTASHAYKYFKCKFTSLIIHRKCIKPSLLCSIIGVFKNHQS